jgi:hypothetical protein
MTEFGANHGSYKALVERVDKAPAQVGGYALGQQLAKSVRVLDLTDWQTRKLLELDLNTIGDVLNATEAKLKQAYYVGHVRARRMRNAALAAVLEYLSG